MAKFLSNWDKMTTCKNKIIERGKVFFLKPIIAVTKTKDYTQPPLTLKYYQKLKSLSGEKDIYDHYLSYTTFRS